MSFCPLWIINSYNIRGRIICVYNGMVSRFTRSSQTTPIDLAVYDRLHPSQQVLMHKALILVFERPHFIYTIVSCSMAKGPQIPTLHVWINKVMCSALSNISRAHRIIHAKDSG